MVGGVGVCEGGVARCVWLGVVVEWWGESLLLADENVGPGWHGVGRVVG